LKARDPASESNIQIAHYVISGKKLKCENQTFCSQERETVFLHSTIIGAAERKMGAQRKRLSESDI